MGDISDDILEGFQCSWCGVCFIEEHGYPVLCDSCQEGTTIVEMESMGLQPTTKEEI